LILLSGATGRVGSAASMALNQAGVPFRVLVRDPDRFVLKDAENIELVQGDLEAPDDVTAAMKDVDKALLLTSNSPAQADIEKQFALIAERMGVRHLVKISSMEASAQASATLPMLHYDSEQMIQSLNLTWTFLRPNFYMQNMLMYSASISEAGVFALPLGDAKTAMVDARDVGAVVAAVLQEDGHQNKIYQLTGSELINFDKVAERMSTVLGKPVAYQKQTADEFRTVLENFIQSQWQLDVVCELFAEIADGSLEQMSGDVERLLGRAPISLTRFTRDFSTAF